MLHLASGYGSQVCAKHLLTWSNRSINQSLSYQSTSTPSSAHPATCNSPELYLHALRCHFIFELIQNFEDNKYSPRAVPEVIFELTDDCLIARNNERGFEEKDVRSLCGVGKSTKKAGDGYIGISTHSASELLVTDA